MGFIPHPTIPLGEIRPLDLLLLLSAGALWELISRLIVLSYSRKSSSLRQRECVFQQLQHLTRQKQKEGSAAFVETSKLERQVLAEEKALSQVYQDRKAQLTVIKKLFKNIGYALSLVIFFVYYGVPVVTMDGSLIETNEILSAEGASMKGATFTKAFMFPLSYVGIGMRISRWGLEDPSNSIGSLLVFWSAQTTVGKIMDGAEALMQ
jgi:hypothetical protein